MTTSKARYEGDLEELADKIERSARDAATDHAGDVPETGPTWMSKGTT